MSRTGNRARGDWGGFTLIELIVVLVGLAIVTAAVVPALRGAGHQEDLTAAADRVAASARFARDEAIARQAAIALTIEGEPATVRLTMDDTQLVGAQGRVGMQSRPLATGLALPPAFALIRLPTRARARLESVIQPSNGAASVTLAVGGDLQMLRFPPEGRTMGGVVVLADDRGHTIRITVAPDTGVVRVEAGNG
jgi:type II secretory pathway pseudopilin PulG